MSDKVASMLYLASKSPQRSLLLAQADIPFRLVATTGQEDSITLANPQAMALERALVKAEGAVLDELLDDWQPEDCVLAADTVVSYNNEVFGKPTDDEDAVRILMTLAGTTHLVTTGQCCYVPARGENSARFARGVAFAKVTMRPASEAEIRDYVATGESSARSGAYAIQESGDRFIVDREGSFDTVVGLNLTGVRNLYRECTGLELPGSEALPGIGDAPSEPKP